MSKILVFGRNSDLGALIVKELGGVMVATDVTDYEAVQAAITTYGPEVVINCAAILIPHEHEWQRTLDINLRGSFNVGYAAAGRAKKIIMLASTAGLKPKLADGASYCASKAGVISLVRSLALEGFQSYCISPARMDTKMRDRTHPDENRNTRLSPLTIMRIIQDIMADVYKAGDNIIVKAGEGIRVS